MSLCLKHLVIRKPDGEQLFEPLDLEIKQGEIVSLMGPSGCGKSTILDAIAGHLSPEFGFKGSIELNNVEIHKLAAHKRNIGILFQDDLLFPHLNVWENLAFALPNDVKGEVRQKQALKALKQISLDHLAEAFPDRLSGGQRARISLTRMLLAKPTAVLLDEPFSKLDKELRQQFREWVFEQLTEANIPTLMVTHDIEDVPTNSRCIRWPWENSYA